MSVITKIFKNPLVMGILTITSLCLALYFGLSSRENRELKYEVHPIRTAIVKNGVSSIIEVSIDGKSVDADVSTVQVALWNAGKRAIKPDNVLETVYLKTENGIEIVEAIAKDTSRKTIDIELDKSRLSEGICGVSWKILEENDGVRVQLTYLGGVDVGLTVEGIIEGQKDIELFEAKKNDKFSIIPVGVSLVGFIVGSLGVVYSRSNLSNSKIYIRENAFDKMSQQDSEFLHNYFKSINNSEKENLYKDFIIKKNKFPAFLLIFVSVCFVVGFGWFVLTRSSGPSF